MAYIPKRYASVDIGTNTIKIKIAEKQKDGTLKNIYYKDFSPGLGKNVNESKIINAAEVSGCISSLKKIKSILIKKKADAFSCVATHGLRTAKNKKEILNLIKSQTGLDVEVISGRREAELTLTGVLLDFPRGKNFACINAGGGSTELSIHTKKENHFFIFGFGAVNLYENYLKDSKNIEASVENIDRVITKFLGKVKLQPASSINRVISVGGSVYNAAYIVRKDKKRNFSKLDHLELSSGDLEKVINLLKEKGVNKKSIPGLDAKRAHTVLPGTLIHYSILNYLKKRKLVLSTRTISDGIIFELSRKR